MRTVHALTTALTVMAAIGLAAGTARADVVIDMPAPPPPATDASGAIIATSSVAEPGDVALERFAEVRTAPRDTYGGWGSYGFGFRGWPGSGYGWGGGWGWGCGYRLSIYPWGGACGFPVFIGGVRIGTSF